MECKGTVFADNAIIYTEQDVSKEIYNIMLNRRKFISETGILSAGLVASSSVAKALIYRTGFLSKRPPVRQRKLWMKKIIMQRSKECITWRMSSIPGIPTSW